MARVISEQPVIAAPGVTARSDRPGMTARSDRDEGYVPASEPGDGEVRETDAETIDKFRRFLRDYVDLKTEEIDERREASRYYHGKQWTEAELRVFRMRNQDPNTYNRVAPKIHGVIGLLERLRQDPKAYPRTPAHEDGAEVATQCLRYALDACSWESALSDVIWDMAVPGIGGWELSLDATDDESHDPVLTRVRPETFFYDPRSIEPDFSDARFLGVAKWMTKDEAISFLPDKAEAIRESVSSLANGTDADALDPEKEHLWWDGEQKRLRLIEVWYREGDRWLYAIHTGIEILEEGESPFVDGKSRPVHRYIMQSANVDERGVRYGFVRNLKGPQDQFNQTKTKLSHAINTRQIIIEEGFVEPAKLDIIRKEAHRPDGVISLPDGVSGKLRFNENSQLAVALAQIIDLANNEITNSAPTPMLAGGQDAGDKSGRAIALLQQAGIAEMGLFIVRVRAMKIRAYALTWEAIRKFWKTPRYVRLTDDDNVAFLAVNQPRMDEYGQVVGMENPIGKVDVDFVLDEGPDTVTLREDAQQNIGNALSAAGQALPPPVIIELSRALVENMNLPSATRKRMMDAFTAFAEAQAQPEQPNPLQMAGAEAEIGKLMAETEDRRAGAALKMEQANTAAMNNAANRLAAEIAMTGRASLV
jgi:hypothetical protein